MAEIKGSGAGGSTVGSFGAERLDAYRVALEFQKLLPQILPRRRHANLRDQLERASGSIALNVSEGAGRWAPNEKAHFYAIARGSAMESAAVLDVLFARNLLSAAVHRHGRGLLVRLIQMLTKLILRTQVPG